jgi:hypothetical protein
MRSRAAPNSICSYAKVTFGGDKREGAGVEHYFFNSLLKAKDVEEALRYAAEAVRERELPPRVTLEIVNRLRDEP